MKSGGRRFIRPCAESFLSCLTLLALSVHLNTWAGVALRGEAYGLREVEQLAPSLISICTEVELQFRAKCPWPVRFPSATCHELFVSPGSESGGRGGQG